MRATLTENHRSTRNADGKARILRLREAMPLAPVVGRRGSAGSRIGSGGLFPVDPVASRNSLIKRHADITSASAGRRPESTEAPARITYTATVDS
jgi:hypothetical protein